MQNKTTLRIAIPMMLAGAVVSAHAAGVWHAHTPYYGAPEYSVTSAPGHPSPEQARLAADAVSPAVGVWHAETPYYGGPSGGATSSPGYATAQDAAAAAEQRVLSQAGTFRPPPTFGR